MAYRTSFKLYTIYGDKMPSVLENDYNSSLTVEVESLNSNTYENLDSAIVSLFPTNFQKDLIQAKNELSSASQEVIQLQNKKGLLEASLQSRINSSTVTNDRRFEISEEIKTLKIEIKDAEDKNKEMEKIYFTLLDQATQELKSDLTIGDENYLKLAVNINIAAKEIRSSSIDVYTSYAIALRVAQQNNMFENFSTELRSLAKGKFYVPKKLQILYNYRIKRLTKNAILFIPNIFSGIFKAHAQASVAKKYIDITNIIIEANTL